MSKLLRLIDGSPAIGNICPHCLKAFVAGDYVQLIKDINVGLARLAHVVCPTLTKYRERFEVTHG